MTSASDGMRSERQIASAESGGLSTAPRGRFRAALAALLLILPGLMGSGVASRLPPADTVEGYVALLLINETPFPGERAWVSEEETKAGMLAILWVLESRLHHIPSGYRQEQIAAERCENIIDVITAGGEKGQCDGFYRDDSGRYVAVRRVHERVDYLVACASRGAPGRFARLLKYAEDLSTAYVRGGIGAADRFAGLSDVNGTYVTGRAYSWMTDCDGYNPGGNFVRIPDADGGSLGGNRFFTLKKLK
ncbi:MAG: hypothetical protein JSR77_13850 [Planctomycetes bacterium]|nr:hypothetical protein [Planctomycetota bacterium]